VPTTRSVRTGGIAPVLTSTVTDAVGFWARAAQPKMRARNEIRSINYFFVIVTVALADFAGSATLVAVTGKLAGVGTPAGAL